MFLDGGYGARVCLDDGVRGPFILSGFLLVQFRLCAVDRRRQLVDPR